MKALGKVFAVLVLFFALIFSLQWVGVVNYQFFGEMKQEADREIFEESQSYVEGKRQQILKYHSEYMKADSEQEKKAILFTVRQATANFDEDKYLKSEGLTDFVKKAKYGK